MPAWDRHEAAGHHEHESQSAQYIDGECRAEHPVLWQLLCVVFRRTGVPDNPPGRDHQDCPTKTDKEIAGVIRSEDRIRVGKMPLRPEDRGEYPQPIEC